MESRFCKRRKDPSNPYIIFSNGADSDDRETLVTFVDRIEVGDKIYPEGFTKMPRKNGSYQQSVRIFCKYIGEITTEPVRELLPPRADIDKMSTEG